MKYRWLAWGLLFGAYAGAFAANVGYFWWSYDVEFLQILASVGYVIVWGWFLISGYQNQRKLRVAIIAGILTMVGGVFGLLARTVGSGILTILGVTTAGLTVTPLYGLLSLIEDYDLFYFAAAALGIFWQIIIICLKKRTAAKTD